MEKQIEDLYKEEEEEAERAAAVAFIDPFPPLTPEIKEIVKQALVPRGPDVIVSGFNVDLRRHDIQTLKPRTWLNDEVNIFNQYVANSIYKKNFFLVNNIKDHQLLWYDDSGTIKGTWIKSTKNSLL